MHDRLQSVAYGLTSVLQTGDEITKLFENLTPTGFTPLGTRLKDMLDPYCRLLEEAKINREQKFPQPVNYIVLTDGKPVPTAEETILTGILKSTAQLLQKLECPENQIGIQFAQVGSDTGAAEFLQDLDDNKKLEFARDIVDTINHRAIKARKGWLGRLGLGQTQDQESAIVKLLVGGVSRYHDSHL